MYPARLVHNSIIGQSEKLRDIIIRSSTSSGHHHQKLRDIIITSSGTSEPEMALMKLRDIIIRARNGTLIRMRTQWDASNTSHSRTMEEAQVIDTCWGEAVQSSRKAKAQSQSQFPCLNSLVIEFVQIAHSQG